MVVSSGVSIPRIKGGIVSNGALLCYAGCSYTHHIDRGQIMTLQVIGAGYGRTGTASLKLALEQIGFGPCHHMSEVLPNPERVALWTRIGAGEAEGNPLLWDQAFEGYIATVDWPACTHWRALMGHYPDAKVILTRRDPAKWFTSVNETILNPGVTAQLAASPMGPMLGGNINRLFDGRMDHREHMMACFEKHNAEVIAGVPGDRLLVFEARDGWGPLCEFLGVEVPDEDYPHVNSMEDTKRFMQMLGQQAEGGADAAQKHEIDAIFEKKG